MKSIKSLFAGILFGAASLLPQAQIQAGDVPKPYVQSSYVSSFVSPAGPSINEKCRQDWASITPVKGLELGIWQNQFEGERSISERDYCITYSVPLTSNLTASATYQYWDYPNARFGNFDSIEGLSLSHSGKLNTKVSWDHLNKNSQTEAGDRFCLSVSKTIPIVESKVKVSLTPSLSTAVNNNYYGNNGLGHVTPGIKLGVSYKNFNASAFFNAQRGVSQDIETLNWGGLSLGYQF